MKKTAMNICLIALVLTVTGCSGETKLITRVDELETELDSEKVEVESLKSEVNKLRNELSLSEEKNISLENQVTEMELNVQKYNENLLLEALTNVIDYDESFGVFLVQLDDNHILVEVNANQYNEKEVFIYKKDEKNIEKLNIPFWGLTYKSYENGTIKFYSDGSFPAGYTRFAPQFLLYDIESKQLVYEEILVPLHENLSVGSRLNVCELSNIKVNNNFIEFMYESTENTVYTGGEINPTVNYSQDYNGNFVIEMVNVLLSDELEISLIEQLESRSFIREASTYRVEKESGVNTIVVLKMHNIGFYSTDFKDSVSFTVGFYE